MIKSVCSSLLAFTLCVLYTACTKGAGPGGRSKIKGKVWATNLASGLSVMKDSGYLGDQDVFITYVTDNYIGDRVTTSFDGGFSFDFLRPGDYKIWTYSKTLFGVSQLDSAVVQNVTIDNNGDVVTTPNFRIYTDKN
jgi:hypothetical protein